MDRGVHKWHGAVMAGAVLLTMACGSQDPVNTERSLYERLGGKPAITAAVDQFVANVAADPRINGRFAATDIPKLKRHLVDQLCAGTGGPCTYEGRDMKRTHTGMKISEAEFGALVEDLVKSLNTLKVPTREQQDLLAILGPMKKDIVEVP